MALMIFRTLKRTIYNFSKLCISVLKHRETFNLNLFSLKPKTKRLIIFYSSQLS